MIAVKQPGRPSLSGPPRDLLVAAGEQGGTSPVLRLRRLSGSTARAIRLFGMQTIPNTFWRPIMETFC
jgi:hypothetical protein